MPTPPSKSPQYLKFRAAPWQGRPARPRTRALAHHSGRAADRPVWRALVAGLVTATLSTPTVAQAAAAPSGRICQGPGIGDIGGLFEFCAAGSSGIVGHRNDICQPPVPTSEAATGGIDALIWPPAGTGTVGKPTLYDSYGTAGQSWNAFDLQCSDMASLVGNNIPEVEFDAAKALERVTITVYQSAAGEGILSVLLHAYLLIMGTSGAVLPWALTILMISLVTVAVFIYRKPFTHLFSAVGYDVVGDRDQADASLVWARRPALPRRSRRPGQRLARRKPWPVPQRRGSRAPRARPGGRAPRPPRRAKMPYLSTASARAPGPPRWDGPPRRSMWCSPSCPPHTSPVASRRARKTHKPRHRPISHPSTPSWTPAPSPQGLRTSGGRCFWPVRWPRCSACRRWPARPSPLPAPRLAPAPQCRRWRSPSSSWASRPPRPAGLPGGLVSFCAQLSSGLISDLNNLCQSSVADQARSLSATPTQDLTYATSVNVNLRFLIGKCHHMWPSRQTPRAG